MQKTEALNPIWYLDRGRALFAGQLWHNVLHRHSTPVYLAGLYDHIALRIGHSEWLFCRAAVIPAGTPYEFDMGGSVLAVVYLEPNMATAAHLRQLLRGSREVSGAHFGRSGEITVLREIYETEGSEAWVGLALDDLIGFVRRRGSPLDSRIACVAQALQENFDRLDKVAGVATKVGLSASRLQHIFTEQVGVPFRRYRRWCRLRAAIGEVVLGSNLTTAAHAVGFADQAHLARDFRRTFGATATPSLARVRGRYELAKPSGTCR